MNWPMNVTLLRRQKRISKNTLDALPLTGDALPLAVCVLDPDGAVGATNQWFRNLAEQDPLLKPMVVGANYFCMIDKTDHGNLELAAVVADVCDMPRGNTDNIAHEFGCGSRLARWYEARAVRLPRDKHSRVLVLYGDIRGDAKRSSVCRIPIPVSNAPPAGASRGCRKNR